MHRADPTGEHVPRLKGHNDAQIGNAAPASLSYADAALVHHYNLGGIMLSLKC